MSLAIFSAVEGLVDETVVRKLILHVGALPGPVHGKEGKARIKARLRSYNEAARVTPWLVLVDLNGDFDCAPMLRQSWLQSPRSGMCFRIAVRETEAWLLADRERFARFMGVSVDRVPPSPENVRDPKSLIVQLARSSSRREIRTGLVPRVNSGRTVGAAYTSYMIDFVEAHWRPGIAAKRATSLGGCLKRLAELGRGASSP